jgi:hypothetical protein
MVVPLAAPQVIVVHERPLPPPRGTVITTTLPTTSAVMLEAGIDAAGVSWVIELGSSATAKSEEQAPQLKEDTASQSPSPVTRFTIKQLPTSAGFTSRGNGKTEVDASETPADEVDANVLFVEGSCVLMVGDQTGSRINPSPPVIGGALEIYGRTAHSGGVCG